MQSDKTNTPNEIIDLVNENDEVIGTTTKGEANSNPKLIHREVGVILFDQSNRILFQKRSKKKLVDPMVWTVSAEGHIPSGLSIEEGAKREVLEELHMSISIKFVTKQLLKFSNETHFMYWFIGKYNGENIIIEPEEVEEYKFLSKQEMKKLISQSEKFMSYTTTIVERFWNNEFSSVQS